MRFQVRVHGLLTAAVDDASDWIEVALPPGTAVSDMIEALCNQLNSPLFDPGSCMATIGGIVVPLDHSLAGGERVELYHLFSGG